MVKATFDVLGEVDKKLVLETEPKNLRKLDEDALIDLVDRVRRARNKHTKLYRREAAARVEEDAARGMVSKKSRRSSARAEVMEDALSRVSRALADKSAETAEALRVERLEQARRAGKGKSGKEPAARAKAKDKGKRKSKPPTDSKSKKFTPASKKARASAKASAKRAQAKRDAR